MLRWPHCLNILLAMTMIVEYDNGVVGGTFCPILEWQGYQNNIRG